MDLNSSVSMLFINMCLEKELEEFLTLKAYKEII